MPTRLRPAPGYCPIEDAIQMKKLDTDPAISCQISHASSLHQAGLDWIDNNDMKSVVLRHYPVLTPPAHPRRGQRVRSLGSDRGPALSSEHRAPCCRGSARGWRYSDGNHR